MIKVTGNISIDESEIQEEFIRSSGPGGQNVNKVATAVQLRFDVASSPSLPDDVRQRLMALAHSRMTEEGVLIINAQRFRTQRRNRQDAMERFLELVREATREPKKRRKTKPSLASKIQRLETKQHRSATKRLRQPVQPPDE